MSNKESETIPLDDFEWFSNQSQENYKRSRAYVEKDEDLVKLYSGVSAWFGEEAFRRVPESDAFIAIVLGRDVINGYFIAERYADVLRFSDVYLRYLEDIFLGDVPRTTQSIIKGIEIIKTVSLAKISPQSPNLHP